MGGRGMKRRIVHEGPGALDLIEEAVHLLRLAPAAAWATFHVGAVPFAVGLLFFWSDMSRGAMAFTRCGAEALGLAALYLWMRTWQARFGARLRAQAAGRTAPAWTARDWLAAAGMQLRTSVWSWLLLPPSALAILPMAWTYAFHQNLVAVSDRPAEDAEGAAGRAWALARLWPHQNHYALSLLFLFGVFVWLNLLTAMVFLPWLAKALLGIESDFTRYSFWMFNTTFLAALMALAYLTVNPLVKAVYALRCHYGEAIHTGADLRADLHRAGRRPGIPASALALALFALAAAPGARAAFEGTAQPREVPPAAPLSAPVARHLDEAIEHVLQRPEFAWRLPRNAIEAPQTKSPLDRFLESVAQPLKRFIRWAARATKKLIEWIADRVGRSEPGRRASKTGDLSDLRKIMWALVVLLAAVGILWLLRAWRGKGMAAAKAVAVPAAAAAPDLEDEAVHAAQLPEEEWLRLADGLRREGELRKAMRALFLGTLACIGRLGWVDLRPSKSNLDYRREIERRTRGRDAIPPLFAEDVAVFERGWYGRHPVTGEALDAIHRNLEGLRREAD